jgi:hypothetical protein
MGSIDGEVLVDQAGPVVKPPVTAVASHAPNCLESNHDDGNLPPDKLLLTFTELREVLPSAGSPRY